MDATTLLVLHDEKVLKGTTLRSTAGAVFSFYEHFDIVEDFIHSVICPSVCESNEMGHIWVEEYLFLGFIESSLKAVTI